MQGQARTGGGAEVRVGVYPAAARRHEVLHLDPEAHAGCLRGQGRDEVRTERGHGENSRRLPREGFAENELQIAHLVAAIQGGRAILALDEQPVMTPTSSHNREPANGSSIGEANPRSRGSEAGQKTEQGWLGHGSLL